MVMTELGLLFIGSLATLTTMALFVDIADRWTAILIVFLSSVLWGIFGISSYDVIVGVTDSGDLVQFGMLPLVLVGIMMSIGVAVYGLNMLLRGFKEEYEATDMGLVD